jgi:hypothetical protein
MLGEALRVRWAAAGAARECHSIVAVPGCSMIPVAREHRWTAAARALRWIAAEWEPEAN